MHLAKNNKEKNKKNVLCVHHNQYSCCSCYTNKEQSFLKALIFIFLFLSLSLTFQAIQDKGKHSISYTLSRTQAVIVEYTLDDDTDMFQVRKSALIYTKRFI